MSQSTETITFPALHPGQWRAWTLPGRFKALRCGRRWGKTFFAMSLLGSGAAYGQSVGYFTPEYKFMLETYYELEKILFPAIEQSSKVDGVIRLKTGGRIDFWTLNNPNAGRSRKYHRVVIDEAAFAGPDMTDIWTKAIQPTLLDYKGDAYVMSTPAGEDEENFFYRICTDPNFGFVQYHAPTRDNPLLPADEIERLRRETHPDVFRQEYEAQFVNWSGTAFFSEDSLLVDGKPCELPPRVDRVFAVIDTALKDTMEHDGTAVVFFAKNAVHGIPLIILDWEVLQIEGSLLEAWLPTVNKRLEDWARRLQARRGNSGMWIEDKASGIVLLQQAMRKGLPAYPIDSKLTSLGKEARALDVSGYVYSGKVKICREAYEKVTPYRGITRNHFLSQFCGFRLGTKTAHAQDLLDCGCYGIALGLGNSEGY